MVGTRTCEKTASRTREKFAGCGCNAWAASLWTALRKNDADHVRAIGESQLCAGRRPRSLADLTGLEAASAWSAVEEANYLRF
jgi:hypothetical protein